MTEGRKRKDREKAVSLRQRGTEGVLFDLFWELAFAYFRLNAAGSKIAAKARLSPGKISILRSLRDAGPQSVAQLARSRPVARQGVQVMADQLVKSGLAQFV
jgi:DNA-binding MarR family transcriptional regulator